MSALLIPNTFQMPNVLVDEIMPTLSGSSLKVLLVIVRKTYGFQKRADKISFRTLRQITGLSRDSVNKGIKGLGALITIIPGARGVPKLEGINAYALNIDIETGKLVRKSDQSENLTSQKNPKKEVRKSDSSKPNLSKPNSTRTNRACRAAPPDPRIKEFIEWFKAEYQSSQGRRCHVKWEKDGNLVKTLLVTFDLPILKGCATMLLKTDDPFLSSTGRDIGMLSNQINKLAAMVDQHQHQQAHESKPVPLDRLEYSETADA